MSSDISPARRDVLELDSGIEALRASPEFRGPVEQLDGHHCNDHLALIYENKADQFAAVVPFIRQGLERGERCMYVVDESTEAAVVAALEAGGVDVDAARTSGQLSFHTVRDTYLRHETFAPDEMIAFYREAIGEATADYEALRVSAEVTWLYQGGVTFEEFMEYESRVNDLFDGEDCIALCQYNRSQLSDTIIRDVIKTHPHLICENTVCHNFYYTPPEEYCTDPNPAREADQMRGTLVERTEAKAELQERQQFLREQHEITSNPDRSFEEKIRRLLALGCRWFDLEAGLIATVDPVTDRFDLEYRWGETDLVAGNVDLALSDTYCARVNEAEGVVGVTDPVAEGYADRAVFEEHGIRTYIGTHLAVDDAPDRTVCFVGTEDREESFTEEDLMLQQVLGQALQNEFEQKHREDSLSALNRLSRSLMDAETVGAMSECVVTAAADQFDLSVAMVALYDDTEGALQPAAATPMATEAVETLSLLQTGTGAGWEAFVNERLRRIEAPFADVSVPPSQPVTELAVLPLDTHGVLVLGTAAPEGFSPTGLDFATAVQSNVEVAFGRAERERRLQDREGTLEAQNETLERLNRVNDIIRTIDKGLVQASSRDEIETVVCEELAGIGPYELAWLGTEAPATGTIEPKTWAGTEKGYLDAIEVRTDDSPTGTGPAGRAFTMLEPQVVNNVLDDPSFEPWRKAALDRGYHSVIALPLVYDNTVYGLLEVYARETGVFDDLERDVLTELADNIAYAIMSVENKHALVSDAVTELEFEVEAADHPFVELTQSADGTVVLDGLVPKTTGELAAFVTTTGLAPATVKETCLRSGVRSVTLISEGGAGDRQCRFEIEVADDSVASMALSHGGVAKSITAANGVATIEIEVAKSADTREFVEMLERSFDGLSLVAQRTRERPRRQVSSCAGWLDEELTDRQREVLETAHFSGYFEKPRARTGGEVAETLGIAQPTFSTHVRSAQRKIAEKLFESDRSVPSPD